MLVFVVLINGEVDKVFIEREEAEKYCAMRRKIGFACSKVEIFEKELNLGAGTLPQNIGE